MTRQPFALTGSDTNEAVTTAENVADKEWNEAGEAATLYFGQLVKGLQTAIDAASGGDPRKAAPITKRVSDTVNDEHFTLDDTANPDSSLALTSPEAEALRAIQALAVHTFNNPNVPPLKVAQAVVAWMNKREEEDNGEVQRLRDENQRLRDELDNLKKTPVLPPLVPSGPEIDRIGGALGINRGSTSTGAYATAIVDEINRTKDNSRKLRESYNGLLDEFSNELAAPRNVGEDNTSLAQRIKAEIVNLRDGRTALIDDLASMVNVPRRGESNIALLNRVKMEINRIKSRAQSSTELDMIGNLLNIVRLTPNEEDARFAQAIVDELNRLINEMGSIIHERGTMNYKAYWNTLMADIEAFEAARRAIVEDAQYNRANIGDNTKIGAAYMAVMGQQKNVGKLPYNENVPTTLPVNNPSI